MMHAYNWIKFSVIQVEHSKYLSGNIKENTCEKGSHRKTKSNYLEL